MRLTALFAAGVVAWLQFSSGPARADEPPHAEAGCLIENLRMIVSNGRDAADVCAGARRALAFFAGHGLWLREPVTLEVVAQLPPSMPPSAAGVYLAGQRRIHVLSFSAFRKFGTWFKLPIDRDIYQSLAAHEVAHAITEANFQIGRPSIHAREYLAYVALFATMTPALRERILRAIPGKGFEDEERISFIIYMFDPMFFGAQSYRHYLRPGNGGAFLRAVLAGAALRD